MIEIALGILLAIFLLWTIELWGPLVFWLIKIALGLAATLICIGFVFLILATIGA